MKSLKGKKILLGVSGSIAAYKTPELVRQLIKSGADVRVITTKAAEDFVSPLSLATVSKHEVLNSVSEGNAWNNHVELGLWADAMLIAPCSANTLAKLAHGLCDNLLTAVYLSAKCPLFIAPAMDEDMWHHSSTKKNIDLVRSYGNHLVPVGHGELASGLVGEGRMAEPEELVQYLSKFFSHNKLLQGKKALVTSGPTYERLDPVRFIGNFSSGKMGIAIAEALSRAGAEVTLVIGPTHEKVQDPSIKVISVESAAQMFDAGMSLFKDCEIAVLAAAVADYRPAVVAPEKIKKTDAALVLKLDRTEDILATMGKEKRSGQILVGFALETENELEHAREKLLKKNADLIVLNSLRDEGVAFGQDNNKVTLLDAAGGIQALPLLKKSEVAEAIIQKIIELEHEKAIV